MKIKKPKEAFLYLLDQNGKTYSSKIFKPHSVSLDPANWKVGKLTKQKAVLYYRRRINIYCISERFFLYPVNDYEIRTKKGMVISAGSCKVVHSLTKEDRLVIDNLTLTLPVATLELFKNMLWL